MNIVSVINVVVENNIVGVRISLTASVEILEIILGQAFATLSQALSIIKFHPINLS